MYLKIANYFKSHLFLSLLLVYVLSHILVININSAEWGDSYRILRSALSIEDSLSYPSDEKRPPLMAAMLAIRPDDIDPVSWGRVFVFGIGVLSFMLFFRLAKHVAQAGLVEHDNQESYLVLACILYIFNPVLFYWSLRVMTDVLFLFFVLLAFTTYYTLPTRSKTYLCLGLLVGLSILTRFEGYILGLAFGSGILLEFITNRNSRKFIMHACMYALGALVLVVPYLVYRNPFTSSYLAEPQGRAYDMHMVLVFLVSFIFLMGFTGASAFFIKSFAFFKKNSVVGVYLILHIALVLLWPAAVPRLFLPVIPFFAIIVAGYIISSLQAKSNAVYILAYCVLTLLFAIAQYKLRLQFLLVAKLVFIAVLGIQAFVLFALTMRKKRLVILGILLSCVIWSFATVRTHKDIYSTLVSASVFAVSNLEGDVLHNDTASIAEWYFNDLYPNDQLTGTFKSLDNDSEIDYNELIVGKKYEYLFVTNEERPYFEFKPNMNYLEEVYSKKAFVNGADFYTVIYRINYD